jgi:hypothetical protein
VPQLPLEALPRGSRSRGPSGLTSALVPAKRAPRTFPGLPTPHAGRPFPLPDRPRRVLMSSWRVVQSPADRGKGLGKGLAVSWALVLLDFRKLFEQMYTIATY